MTFLLQCGNLADNVNSILNLLAQEANITIETTAIEASLKKAVAPKFEIVFAAAFSAGSGATPFRVRSAPWVAEILPQC